MTLKKFHFIITTVAIGAILLWVALVFLNEFNSEVVEFLPSALVAFIRNFDEAIGMIAFGVSAASVVLSIFRIADRRS